MQAISIPPLAVPAVPLNNVAQFIPALELIQSVGGVYGFVNAVNYGVLTNDQTLDSFRAIDAAVDSYAHPPLYLSDLRSSIQRFSPHKQSMSGILGQLLTYVTTVDKVVHAFTFGAVNTKAPFDLGNEWCWMPYGKFWMGSPHSDMYGSEKLELIQAGGLWMMKYPVTNMLMNDFLTDRGDKIVRIVPRNFADHPAVFVDQHTALECADWIGERVRKQTGHSVYGRLPREAEWEYAAKGPSGREFVHQPSNNEAFFRVNAVANNGHGAEFPYDAFLNAHKTRTVFSRNAYSTGFGVSDMIGNVFEWMQERGVVRGAAYAFNTPQFLRAAASHTYDPNSSLPFVGLRPVLVLRDELR